MNKKGNTELTGVIIFVLSIVIFAFYMMNSYIPALQADISNTQAFTNALVVGLICGIGGLIGLIMARR